MLTVLQGIESLRSSKVFLDNGRLKGSIARDGSFVVYVRLFRRWRVGAQA